MTAQTELRALLEDAAYAMGYKIVGVHCDGTLLCYTKSRADFHWQPHLDSADGAEMEAFLKLNVEWCGSYVMVTDSETDARCSEHFIGHENDQSARRMASLRVAAAIGKAKREQEGKQ